MSRKRMRLSSPTFDDQVGDLSQDDINAFNSFEAQLSQSHDNSDRIYPAFTSATARLEEDTDDEPHREVDYSNWFDSDASTTAAIAFSGFQRASVPGENAKSLYIPSAAALLVAEEKMKKWQQDIDASTKPASPPRVAFASARNIFSEAPETPSPAVHFRTANPESTPTRPHGSLLNSKRQPKPFKSPLLRMTPRHLSTPSIGSPLHADRPPVMTAVSPLRPSSIANHIGIQKPLGFTPTVSVRPRFIIPFKADTKCNVSKASMPENLKLSPSPSGSKSLVNRIYPPSAPLLPRQCESNTEKRVFDLTPPSGRQTLATSGLRPQAYTAEQLENMGIEFRELDQINLRTAPFYTFCIRSRSSESLVNSSSLALGRLTALEELHTRGCMLAKQAWVDNHWSLILWKLAGMVALDPVSESDPSKKRWCWLEVVRQLMYRYERDLNNASRPSLRLITTRDASAESPMVLCISDIIWLPSSSQEDVTPAQMHPELEVTDGWYRLRARIDAPIARGIRKGKIKIGRKIAIASAKLSAERKEGSEILEAYDSNILLLSGNSTHMAPWDAKLGFQRGPFIATLSSLTSDGGNIAVMMLTVTKVYPVAYIEFIEDADGRKQREGPHDAKEELKLSSQWRGKRELHASKLWSEYEKRRRRLLDHAEHLEQRTGSKFRPRHDDGPPDKIYDMYDDMREDPESAKNTILTIGLEDAGWLARHIRERITQERDKVSQEIEQELESTCPPRAVKAFCVVVVHDTRTHKCSNKRTAQVTVWDVPGVSASEGCIESPFVSGQRYLVTNLVPTQTSAWMDSSGGEVYLSTRKNSKWTLVN